jgi:Intracellular septation protein A
MKALLDFVPLIIFFYLYKTVDPKDTQHPLLQLIGSAGGVDNNNILVATSGLIISMLVVYGALFVMQKFRLDKQQWIVLFMTVIFGGITLMLSDDFYIR